MRPEPLRHGASGLAIGAASPDEVRPHPRWHSVRADTDPMSICRRDPTMGAFDVGMDTR